ncbi:MAG TPA: hypothetical protein VFD37_04945, partial [Solirubrobacterales bacterium]|nr:hypothetical protein [Solirubrobacterales bacterium]
MAAELIRLAGESPLIVGLDFAFSFPAWFVKERLRADRVEQVWDAAERDGEDWLRSCEPPF